LAETPQDVDALARFKAAWGAATKNSATRIDTFRANWRAYRGVLEPQTAEAIAQRGRDSQLAPAYVYQAVEVLWANMMSRDLTTEVLPRTPDKEEAAELWTEILQAQEQKDRLDYHIGWFGRQALIQGWSPAKVPFRYERVTKTRRVFTDGPNGYPIEQTVQQAENQWNQPVFVPILCEDFWFDPSASFWEQCGYCLYRTFHLTSSLRQLEADGVYRSIDQVAETRGPSNTNSVTGMGLDRSGRVEVVEFWTRDRLITVANRSVVIQDEPNPYWHSELPFVIGTSTPDLYGLMGRSVADLLKPLQAMVWALMNQRLDGSRLALMPLFSRLATSLNRDQYVKRDPGLIYNVNNHDELHPMQVDTTWIAPAMSSEQDLRNQMNDISGNSPYLSGVADENVDPKTATLVQSQSSAAQKRVSLLRQSILADPLEQAGQQRLELNQQFLRTADVVRVDRENGLDWVPVTPNLLSGSYDFRVTDEDADLDQQKRRDAALALFGQVMAQVPNLVALGIKPTSETLDEVYKAFGYDNPERFYTEQSSEPPGSPLNGGSGLPGGAPFMPPTTPSAGPPPGAPTRTGVPGVNGLGPRA
jgi:hypothetical protein